jgi:metallophosphoesterase (TIGR00282 family)
MRIFFLGDIVGRSGRLAVVANLKDILKKKKIDFVIVNGENAADQGVGITEEISNDLFNSGVDVITTGNHVWDQNETANHIERETRLLRPENISSNSPGKGFGIYKSKNGFKVGVLNLMGNVFMKKCDDVFKTAEIFKNKYKLKEDYDFLVVDFHGEITSEKMAMGYFFDGKASLVVGTHTHVPTNDVRILVNGTAYQTDAGMCGDYDSVIGMNKENSLNRFLKKNSIKHYPAEGEATLSGIIVECDTSNGLANKVEPFIFGGRLINNY